MNKEIHMDFYLQDSRSYCGNDLMFWAKGGNGYTTDLRMAQVYTREQAQRQHLSRPTDIPWPVEYIIARARPVIDHQTINLAEALRDDPVGLQLNLERCRCIRCGVFMSESSFWAGSCPRCGQDNRP